jgi:hypothetical protein
MAPCPARRCCYCKSGNHYIQQCDSDPHLKYIFESKIMPDFRSMKAHVLKRLCSIIKKKTNEHKNELVNNLETYWNKKHGKTEENEQNDEKEEKEPCAICLEKITENNSCITKCGHHFCLTCLLQHYSNNNSCPLCREKISENDVHPESSLDSFGEYNEQSLSRTVSYNRWEDEEIHEYFETDDNITVIDIDDSSIRDLDIVNTEELEYQPNMIEQSVFEPTSQPTISEPTMIHPTSINPTNYNETYLTVNNDLINRITLLEQFSNNENNEIANDMYRFIYNRINTQFRSEINNHINERVIELVNSRLNNLTHNIN